MRVISILLASIICSACATTVELSSALQPPRPEAARSSEAAAVVCSPELLAHVERARMYKFELGEPLCSALVRSVEASYRSAERNDKPTKGQYSRVVHFYLQDSALDVKRLPNGSVRVAYSVGVAVETCGRDLKPETRKLVRGDAVITRRDAKAAELVKETAEAALVQVAGNASQLLVGEVDGPRLREDVPAAAEH
jgi:hypothetical protein